MTTMMLLVLLFVIMFFVGAIIVDADVHDDDRYPVVVMFCYC